MSRTYFNNRDADNIEKLDRILYEDLPDFCQEYFVGISSYTTPLTRLNYAYDIRTFFNYLTKKVYRLKGKTTKEITPADLESLSPFEIEAYLNYVEIYKDGDGKIVKNSARGKSRKLAALRSLIKYFEKKQIIRYNPTASVDTPKLREKEIIRLDTEEIGAMLDVVDTGDGLSERQQKYQENTRVRDLAMVSLMLGTGIRVSELVGLDIDDINFKDLSFVVTRKGGARVILYFSEEVAGYLYDYYSRRIADTSLKKEPALFISLQKRRITTRAVENIIKKYSLVAAPLKHITPHKLRSTFGTQLYRNTGDIYVVADVLGHKDVNTTKRHYAAITDDIRRNAATKVRLHATDNSDAQPPRKEDE
ncbi:MAG: tyrosine-type recombinase/integrase [Firmicutes bacterium]|nr:tyrosine-type recombinase/integrase [Bacillota bacterium]